MQWRHLTFVSGNKRKKLRKKLATFLKRHSLALFNTTPDSMPKASSGADSSPKTDRLISDMEKFIHEKPAVGGNGAEAAGNINTQELLSILDDDGQDDVIKPVILNGKSRRPSDARLLRSTQKAKSDAKAPRDAKRKKGMLMDKELQKKEEQILAMFGLPSIKEARKMNESRRKDAEGAKAKRKSAPKAEPVQAKRSKGKEPLKFASIRSLPSTRLCQAAKLPQKKRAKAVEVLQERRHRAAVAPAPDVRCDAVLVDSVVVKREVVDLTSDDGAFYMLLNFAVTTEIKWRSCRLLDNTVVICTPKYVEHVDELHWAILDAPDVRLLIETVIDLTGNDAAPVELTHRECASRIFLVVYKFYKYYGVIAKARSMIDGLRACLSAQEVLEDMEPIARQISVRIATLGDALLEKLSKVTVKDLDTSRLFHCLIKLLVEGKDVVVSLSSLYLYVELLLSKGQDFHRTPFVREFVTQVLEVAKSIRAKLHQRVFTPQQLAQLYGQIESYHQIASRQAALMQPFDERPDLSSGLLTVAPFALEIASSKIKMEPEMPPEFSWMTSFDYEVSECDRVMTLPQEEIFIKEEHAEDSSIFPGECAE